MKIKIEIEGQMPLILHSQRGMNPRDPLGQDLAELQSKRGKTLDDRARISDLEMELGLYYDAELGPFMPYLNVKRCIQDGGKMLKLGRHIEQSLRPVPGRLNFAILYRGPRDSAGLIADPAFRDVRTVKVPPRTGKVVDRTRPIFREWALHAYFMVDEERLDLRKVQDCCRMAGEYVGLGDFRPEYGIFTALVTEVSL